MASQPACLDPWHWEKNVPLHPPSWTAVESAIFLMALSGKSQNTFLFRMQKTHIKTSSKKGLLCHKCTILYTLYLMFFTYSIFFLHKNIGSLSYARCLLLKLPSRVREMHHRQACRQQDEMGSKVDQESAGLGWDPRECHLTSLLWTSASFSKVNEVLVASSTVWRVMKNTKPLGSYGTLFLLPWDTLDHLPFLRASCPGICHHHEVRRHQRRNHILVTENQTMAAASPLVGKHEQTDFFWT